MRYYVIPSIVLCLLSGCATRHVHTLGDSPQGTLVTAVGTLKKTSVPIIVRGIMVEKCPISGCWFTLRDSSGTIKVDTRNAGFVVAEVPLNTEVTVTGMFQTKPERQIAAIGLRY